MRESLMAAASRTLRESSVYRSIVRHGIADTNRNRSLIVFENVFLHVHPVKVREKTPFDKLDEVLDLVTQAEAAVQPAGGRVLLRYSGTESKARLLIEGREPPVLEKWSKKICEAIKRQVGA